MVYDQMCAYNQMDSRILIVFTMGQSAYVFGFKVDKRKSISAEV